MRTNIDPMSVTRDCLYSALRQLGLVDLDDITDVTIDGGKIQVTRVRRDDDGQMAAAGDEIATYTTVIGINRDKDAA